MPYEPPKMPPQWYLELERRVVAFAKAVFWLAVLYFFLVVPFAHRSPDYPPWY